MTDRRRTELPDVVRARSVALPWSARWPARAGCVTVDPDGVVRSLVRGEATDVGRAAPARLVADTDGTRAAWIDDGDAVVLDLAAEDGVLVSAGDDLGNASR